jgi:aarF domain-containing kinase
VSSPSSAALVLVADPRFASAILLRPFQVNKNKRAKQDEPEKNSYEQQMELKRRMRTMLENEQLIPRVSEMPDGADCRN